MADYIDYYSLIDEGIKVRLRLALATDFKITKPEIQISSNEANLNRGHDYFIVTRAGPFPTINFMQSGEIQDVDWTTRVQIFVRFHEQETKEANFTQFRDAVIFHLNKYRFLGDAIINETPVEQVPHVDRIRSITAGGDATYFQLLKQQVNFYFQSLAVVTRQRVRFG